MSIIKGTNTSVANTNKVVFKMPGDAVVDLRLISTSVDSVVRLAFSMGDAPADTEWIIRDVTLTANVPYFIKGETLVKNENIILYATTGSVSVRISGFSDSNDISVPTVAIPVVVFPTPDSQVISSAITMRSTAFIGSGLHIGSMWKITTDVAGTAEIWTSGTDRINLTSITADVSGVAGVTSGTSLFLFCKHEDSLSGISGWSAATRVIVVGTTTGNITSPAVDNDKITLTSFTATCSAPSVGSFTSTHVATDWKLTDTTGATVLKQSLNDTTNKLSYAFTGLTLTVNVSYKLAVRQKTNEGGWGDWKYRTVLAYGSVVKPTLLKPANGDIVGISEITCKTSPFAVDGLNASHVKTVYRIRKADGTTVKEDISTTELVNHTVTGLTLTIGSSYLVDCKHIAQLNA